MRKLLLLVMLLMFGPCMVQAATLSIGDPNNPNFSLAFNYDDPAVPVAGRIQYPRTIIWNVGGRRIVVYPSSPALDLDIDHIHSNAHVASNQIHAQGPYFKDAKSSGNVTEGIVYTIEGVNGISRIVEKVDLFNKTAGSLAVQVVGMGWTPQPAIQPNQVGLEIPDFTGVTGTTVAFMQGHTPTGSTGSITDPPFATSVVLPIVSFAGFNPVNQVVDVPAGAALTVITELKLAP